MHIRKIVTGIAVIIALLAVIIVIAVTGYKESTDTKTAVHTPSTTDTVRYDAEPQVGGFYQILWKCHASDQEVSFHLLTQGTGYLTVVIEDIDPSTQPYSVKPVLHEEVFVSDANRDEVESREFSSVISSGHHVHFGVTGTSGAANSQDHTFSKLVC